MDLARYRLPAPLPDTIRQGRANHAGQGCLSKVNSKVNGKVYGKVYGKVRLRAR